MSVRTYRGEVPTSLTAIHECTHPEERLLSLYVCNTTSGNVAFTAVIDDDGTDVEVMYEIPVKGSASFKDLLEWVPGLFPLTKARAAGPGEALVGDIVKIGAGASGLKYHLSVEVPG